MRRPRHGSSTGEQMILLALAALLLAAVAAAFSHSVARGVTLLAAALGLAGLAFAFGVLRDARAERRRAARVRLALERSAAALPAALEAIFPGTAHGGPAVFGVAGAAGRLVYAREGRQQAEVTVIEFDRLDAAFARPEDAVRFRLEARAGRGGGAGNGESMFVVVQGREDAERWVRVLQAHLGARAKLVSGGRVETGG